MGTKSLRKSELLAKLAKYELRAEQEARAAQGYTNTETFTVIVTWDNDRPKYEWARRVCASGFPEMAGEQLKQAFLRHNSVERTDLYGALLCDACERVNWTEVAKHFAAPLD